jgi:cell division protein FtsN
MARDYKRRAPARRKKPVAPGWVWLLAGLTVGLFVAFLVYLNERDPGPAPTARSAVRETPRAAAKPAPKPAAPAAEAEAPAGKKPLSYDFYTILPEFEVEVPEERNPPREKPVQAVNTPGTYLLQVGSFRNARDADTRKAELAMLGIVSAVQAVSVEATTFHRVRIGPFEDLERLNRVRQTLRENGIEFMTLKTRS